MSFPTWATEKMKVNKYPTTDNVVPCKHQDEFGDLTLVINGKDYVLTNEEWMFPAEDMKLAQGGA